MREKSVKHQPSTIAASSVIEDFRPVAANDGRRISIIKASIGYGRIRHGQ